MITLDGTHGWVVTYTNKHNISGKIMADINIGNWTFCSSFQPEWNPNKLILNLNNEGYRGGIVVRNGMHSGIFNVLWPADDERDGWMKFIKGEIWYDTPDGSTELAMLDKRVFGNGWVDVVLSYDRVNSKLIFSTRESEKEWEVQEMVINGEIIDYSGAHVWIGCANGFESCPEPQFYSGNIRGLGIFNSVLSEKDRDRFFKEYHDFRGIPKYFRSNAHKRQVYNFEKMDPLTFTNFKTKTTYKSFDFSGNGNHPIIFKREWGVY